MDLHDKINARNKEIILIITALIISFLAHAVNMFGYPYYESDEGTYISQAWSILKLNQLAPYEYWYDHPPFGWLLIALWMLLTGGMYVFGLSVNSGRVLMLVMHLFSSLLLYLITKKFTRSAFTGTVSVLIFSVSPLAVFFHRRVLLDNIAVFWLLLSITIILYRRSNFAVLLSAASYGFSFLTKESMLVFSPVMLYLVYVIFTSKKRKTVLWFVIASLIILTYPLFALFRGQLFPNDTGISLWQSVMTQVTRRNAEIAGTQISAFWFTFSEWIKEDPVLIYLGIGSIFLNIMLGLKSLYARIIALFSVVFVTFLYFNSLVLEFYIVPILPFFALNISYFMERLKNVFYNRVPAKLRKISYLPYFGIVVSLLVMFFRYSNSSKDFYNIYRTDQTTGQRQAISWMVKNIPPGSKTISDSYAYVDLNDGNKNRRFDYYWKVDFDPDIKETIYGNSWNNVDYIAMTPQMERDLENNSGFALTSTALKNSKEIQRFFSNGWGVRIFKVNQ